MDVTVMERDFTQLLALAPAALIWGLGVLALVRGLRLGLPWRSAVLLLTMALSLIPIGEISPATWLRGVTGDLSLPSLALLCMGAGALILGRPLIQREEKRWLAVIFGCAALFLYPCALGLTDWDPYALGYRPVALATALFLVILAATLFERYLVAVSLMAAMLAHRLQILESSNLWDYVIDPGIAVYTLSAGITMVLRDFVLTPHNRRERS
jgi:hypothetical protein